MAKQVAHLWVDGGMLGGRNPSLEGVFWSVYRTCPDKPGQIVIYREESTTYFTNNDAEWLALRAALRYAAQHHVGCHLRIYSDSRLIVNQYNNCWKCHFLRFRRIRQECWQLAAIFPECTVEWRPRNEMVQRLGH